MAVVAVIAVATTPAAAQFSDGYKFIKAVKDKDGAAAEKILNQPGTTLVNVRDGASGDMAIHIVIKRRDISWLGYLLQRDANPNVRDGEGATPLLLAATSNFDEAVKVLTDLKVQVDLPNRLGETPLLKAVQLRNASIARMLLDAGANPDATDNSGNSPRSVALADARGGPIARMLKDAPARKAAPTQGPVLR
ncbi:ankyrin repeat domain-containing protein [Sphingosinicellaceae bacterium]|nr:ankyrin repeat domain-containing protein [Sphingosinicellaceae bacterium]